MLYSGKISTYHQNIISSGFSRHLCHSQEGKPLEYSHLTRQLPSTLLSRVSFGLSFSFLACSFTDLVHSDRSQRIIFTTAWSCFSVSLKYQK